MKTKPTQHSVMRLREAGLDPDIIVCRTEENHHLSNKLKRKIGLFCNVESYNVFESPDVDSIYEIPIVLLEQGFEDAVTSQLSLTKINGHEEINYLQSFIRKYKNPEHHVTIAICGKYNTLQDSYKSILEAFVHAGVANNTSVNVRWLDMEELEANGDIASAFVNIDGILIPGGFGNRGIEGKIRSSQYARENQIPFFGICLGLQCAVIDIARNWCGLPNANSAEIYPRAKYPVVDIMPGQKKIKAKGATMRLGDYLCELNPATKTKKAYRTKNIHERHRHRYEVNNKFLNKLLENGLIVSGRNPDLDLVEIIESKDHPWFVGVQFHPELKSRILKPHPLFRDFIAAAINFHYGTQ